VQASANGKQRAAPAASAPSGGAPAGGAASGDAPSSGAEPAGAPPANTPPASQPIVRSAPVTAPWQRPARSRDGETRRNGTNAAAAAERFAPAPGLDDPSLGFAGRSDGPAVDGAAASARAPVAQPPRAAPSAGAFPAPDGQRGDAAFVDGETLRFAVPTDGTLQFLPGRLEVVAGPDSGREVRFVRIPGDPAVRVTFGRSEGPPYRHVQLHARTVSRQHAEMQLTDEHWELRNLSTTNPVVLNGRLLAHDEVAPLLVQGDRIEMGEVVFVFHER
jgi:hypothetical protein